MPLPSFTSLAPVALCAAQPFTCPETPALLAPKLATVERPAGAAPGLADRYAARKAATVGKGVSTTLAKSTAVIRRVGEAQWELIIRRSFADYLYRWLLDASEEYGVFVAR